ncbi:MAG TPA: hypothetical protein VFV38_15845, partial [Ktedonobacteraceae bacterium]|nr:hypothetical protein [Ktedonobacteraceae bacterium]
SSEHLAVEAVYHIALFVYLSKHRIENLGIRSYHNALVSPIAPRFGKYWDQQYKRKRVLMYLGKPLLIWYTPWSNCQLRSLSEESDA